MRLTLLVPAVLLIGLGLVWTGQGLGYIRGSFMTGQPAWVVIGGACMAIGAGLALAARPRRSG